MKIAQVVCVYPPYRGGIGGVAHDYTKNLVSRNHQVTVFTPFDKFRELGQKNIGDIDRLKSCLRFGNAAVLPQLFFKLNNFDIVYLHYPFFGSAEIVFLLKLFSSKKFKLVIHYHMDTRDLSFFKKIFTLPSVLIRKKLFNLADLIVCASLDYIESSQIGDVYKQGSEKFVEIPFSVDTGKFKSIQDINNKNINITFVGGMDRAHDFKGIDILIKAFSELKQNNLKLNLIGNGELIDDYKKLAKKLAISDKVKFFTGINDDEKIVKYQKTDIFVLPSVNSHEAFGIVLLEAMSCGVPVVASSLPGVRKVFENNKQGLTVEPGDVNDLREKLEELIVDKEKRIKMGIEGRKLVEINYNKEKINKKLEDILLGLLK